MTYDLPDLVIWIESAEDKVRRDSARLALSKFATRKSNDYPSELLDFDDSKGEEAKSDWPDCVGVLDKPSSREIRHILAGFSVAISKR